MRVREPMRRSSIYFATFVLLTASAFAQSYKLLQPIPIGGDGAWDYLKADVEARRLYVSHSGEVVVLDLDSQKRLGTLNGFGFIHGILVVEKLNTGFLTDGQKNEVVTFVPEDPHNHGTTQDRSQSQQYGLRREHRANLCRP
jgi:hypothetical protein